MLIIAANIRRGMCVSVDGRPCIVDSCSEIKYGKGAAFAVADLHDIVFNTPHSVRLNPMDRIERNELATKRTHYLRRDGDDHIFEDCPASYQTAPPRNVGMLFFGFQCCDVGYEPALSRDVSFLPPINSKFQEVPRF